MSTTFHPLANNAKTNAITNTLNNVTDPLTFNVTPGTGTDFPVGSFVTAWDDIEYPDPGDDENMEIMEVTARTANSLTCTRAACDTTAQAHAGAPAVAIHTLAQHFTAIHTAVNTAQDDIDDLEGEVAAIGYSLAAGIYAGIWRKMTCMGDGSVGPYPLGFVPIAGALFNVELDGLGGLQPTTHYTVTGTDITFTAIIATDVQIDVSQ